MGCLFQFQHAEGISCKSQIQHVSEELSIAVLKNNKTSLNPDFNPPWSVKTHFSKERTECHGENQQTDLFVWVVKHRNECRNAFQAPHVRLDLGRNDKKSTVVHKHRSECHEKSRAVTEDCADPTASMIH